MYLCFLLSLFVLSNVFVTNAQQSQPGRKNETNGVRDPRKPSAPLGTLERMDFKNIRLISFVICRTDPQCARRFFIDKKTFDFNQFRYLFERFADEIETREYLQNNFAKDIVKKAWLQTMRLASFCTENEIPDSHGNCVCKNGKICHEQPANAYSGDGLSFTVVFIVLILVIIYYSAVHLSAVRVIHNNSLRLLRYYKNTDD